MIITLAQVKSLLGISGTSKDALISALIPEAEAKYLQIRNIPFKQIQGNITALDKTITVLRLYPYTFETYKYNGTGFMSTYLYRMEYLFNSTYNIDNYITDIDTVYNTLEIDTVSGTTADDVVFTVYPQGSKIVSAKLISYFSQKNSMNGLQSESVGSYSWSKGSDNNPFGVPSDIFKSITRYVDA